MNIFKSLVIAGAVVGSALGIVGLLGEPTSTLIASLVAFVFLTGAAALIGRHYLGLGNGALWVALLFGSTALWDGIGHLNQLGYTAFLLSMLTIAVVALMRERRQGPAPA